MGPLIKCSYFYVFLFILYLSIIIFLSVYPVINKKNIHNNVVVS